MMKVSRQSTTETSRMIRLDASEKVTVGVDVHKKTYHVAVWSLRRQALVASWVQPANPARLVSRLRPHGDRVTWVVYEAGPTGFTLVRQLREAGFAADAVAPSEIPATRSKRAKSDRLDCRHLAECAAKKDLRPVYTPSLQEEADRQVVRLRGLQMKRVRKIKAQIKSFLLQHGLGEPDGINRWRLPGVASLHTLRLRKELRFCLDVLLEELHQAQSLLKTIDVNLKALADCKRHVAAVELFRTTPGVGLITALTVRTELLDPQRFGSARQVSLMMGLAPRVRSSGETRREGPLMRSGNGRLKTALVEAAWNWVRLDKKAARRFRHLTERTASAKKAIVAMARKLGIILWRMSLTGECYRAAA